MTGKKRLRRITAFILALILILQGTGQYTIADGTQGRSIVSNVVYAAEGDSGQTTTSQKLQNGSFEDGENDQSWNGKNYNQPTQDKVPYWNTTASDKKIELFNHMAQINNQSVNTKDILNELTLEIDKKLKDKYKK